jgi:hypothetical protein
LQQKTWRLLISHWHASGFERGLDRALFLNEWRD